MIVVHTGRTLPLIDLSGMARATSTVKFPVQTRMAQTGVEATWTAGHNFAASVIADNACYPISDLQQSVRNAAWAASYWNRSGAGRTVWDNYRASGYPTAAGAGNATLVQSTRELLIRAARYATGP
jgi:hypothetical protein